MSEVLDDSHHLVIAVESDGVSDEVQLLLELELEGLDDESDLEVVVGGENLGGVDFLHLEAPFVEHDDLLGQVDNVYVGELAAELLLGLGSVGAGLVEVSVGDQEVGEGLLDVALDGLLEAVLNGGPVATLVEHLGVELLESTVSRFSHFVDFLFSRILGLKSYILL